MEQQLKWYYQMSGGRKTMYNVLIVDDEQLMLTYLANNITPICPQFQITGIANDGLEAMEKLKQQKFDLVITDIRMPEMDGLSLAKYIYETSPLTRIIIISGYNDFEYARMAIQYQVTDYLLKPLKDDNLKEVLAKAREQLDSIRFSKYIATCQNYDSLETEELKAELFHSIITGDENLTYLLFTEAEKRNVRLSKKYCLLMVLSIEELYLLLQKKSSFDVTSNHLILNQVCREYCQKNNIMNIYDSSGKTLLLIDSDRVECLEERAIKIYHAIYQMAVLHGISHISAACGDCIEDILELTNSLMDADNNLALSLISNRSPILMKDSRKYKDFLEELNKSADSVYTDFIVGSATNIKTSISNYCTLFEKNCTNADLLRYSSFMIKYICLRSNIKSTYVKRAYDELTTNIDQIMIAGKPSKENIYETVFHSIAPLFETQHKMVLSESKQIVEEAKRYILTHYKEPISLSLIADEIGVNSCYLSDLIHKNLGETYSKYVIRIRMEQAVRILKRNPNEKIYQVAEDTGFVSTKHFITVFKKFYGITPAVFAGNDRVIY